MGCIHGWVPQQEPWHFWSCVMSFETWIQQNECSKMLNNERGLCMFRLSTSKCYNEWFKSIEQILNVLFKYKPKRNVGPHVAFPKMTFSFGVPKPQSHACQIISFFGTHVSYTFLNFWNVNLSSTKLIWFFLINASFYYEKNPRFEHQFHKI
jgi:hypothetical protein